MYECLTYEEFLKTLEIRWLIWRDWIDMEKDLTKQDFRITEELLCEYNYVNAIYETWFDVDEVLGIEELIGEKTRDNDDSWVNFYSSVYTDGRVEVFFTVVTNDADVIFEIPVNENEKQFFRNLMNDYSCKKYGKTLESLLEELRKEMMS